MQVSVVSGGLASVNTRSLVMYVFEEGIGSDPLGREIDNRVGGSIGKAIESGEISTSPHKCTTIFLPGEAGPRDMILIGAGKQQDWTPQCARTLGGTAVRQLQAIKAPSGTIALPSVGDRAASAAALSHGATLADFSTAEYKTRSTDTFEVEQLTVLASGADTDALSGAVEKGAIIGAGTNLARRLVNEPGNKLTPSIFAAEAEQVARANGLEVHVMDEAEMKDNGYGSILGVSRGSQEPARMVTLRYRGESGAPTIGLVGKGITFDSGGLSLKTADGMKMMKGDMSGAAAVLGAMQAIAQLQPRTNVLGVLCLSENLPSGDAVKPGDILTAGNGLTIEVLNTDAEGRLVLADGLTHARSQGATHLVDVATLTGACVVALGNAASGAFGSHQPWTDLVLRAADHMGEKVWQLPLYPEYREQLNSDVADIANVGGREAGACTAATFLKEFAEESPWVHLDIAGTFWNSGEKPYMAKGPSGVAVSTLVQIARLVDGEGLPD